MTNEIKTMYVRDPLSPRVVTLVRRTKSQDESGISVEFAFSMNAVASSCHYSERLENTPYFKSHGKWWQGDTFNRKLGREIAIGRLEHGKGIEVFVPKDAHVVDTIFGFMVTPGADIPGSARRVVERAVKNRIEE